MLSSPEEQVSWAVTSLIGSCADNMLWGSLLRIAFVDKDLSLRTGSRRFTCEVARELQDLGHEVKIFTSSLDTRKCFGEYLSLPVEVISRGGISHEKVPSALRRAVHHRGVSSILTMVEHYGYGLRQTRFALDVSERIAEMDCKVALVHYHGEHWLAPYFYSLNEPVGAVYLNMVPPRPRRWALPFQEATPERRLADKLIGLPPVGQLEKRSLGKVALFIAPSRFQLRQAEMQGVIGAKRAAVVPLGVDHEKFRPTGEEEKFALYLGRIHPHKSLELALWSMKDTRPDCSLIVAGDIDEQNLWYRDALLDLAKKLKISDRFELILYPSDSQVVRLMQSCSVFLFPSTIDTFGLVVLEAMACGKPVVACNRGGVPEIVGDSGFLLEPRSDLWHEAVVRLLSDPEFRRQMGQKALVRSGAFSWEKTAKQFLASLDGNPALS